MARGRPKLRRMTSQKQNRFMWKFHPRLAKRFTSRMKRSGHTKHPVKPLPTYSQTPAAKAARRRKSK